MLEHLLKTSADAFGAFWQQSFQDSSSKTILNAYDEDDDWEKGEYEKKEEEDRDE